MEEFKAGIWIAVNRRSVFPEIHTERGESTEIGRMVHEHAAGNGHRSVSKLTMLFCRMQGAKENVNMMKTWLMKTGSPMSKIDHAEFKNEREVDVAEFPDFSIRRCVCLFLNNRESQLVCISKVEFCHAVRSLHPERFCKPTAGCRRSLL